MTPFVVREFPPRHQYPTLFRHPNSICASVLEIDTHGCHDPWNYKTDRIVYTSSSGTFPSICMSIGYDPTDYTLHTTHYLVHPEMGLEPLFPCCFLFLDIHFCGDPRCNTWYTKHYVALLYLLASPIVVMVIFLARIVLATCLVNSLLL